MLPVLPLIAAGALAVGLWAMSKKDEPGATPPQLPAGPSPASPPPVENSAELPTDSGSAVGPGTGTAAVPSDALPASGGASMPEPSASMPQPAPAPSAAPPVTGNPQIGKGSTGDAVKRWQAIIGVTQDGIFGDATIAATKIWQKAHGLTADGIVGPKSWLAAASPGGVVPATGKTAGAVSVSQSGAVDDAFEALVAAAIAKGDVKALMALADQAQARGLLDIARSIRDEAARLSMGAPAATPAGPNKPTVPSVAAPTGRAVISAAAGSKGPDVVEWQKVIGVKQDGFFGAATDAATKAWQKAHGLTADGIVGPKSWALAYTQVPSLATAPRPAVAVITPTARPLLSAAAGSTGKDVAEWQGIIGVKADGIFGSGTDAATKVWQKSHGLKADGIVGPTTWAMAYSKAPALAITIGTPVIDKPVQVSPAAPSMGGTYTVKSGDMGTTIAKRFTNDGNRWRELVTANPETKDAKYGLKANPGKVLKLPSNWPSTPQY